MMRLSSCLIVNIMYCAKLRLSGIAHKRRHMQIAGHTWNEMKSHICRANETQLKRWSVKITTPAFVMSVALMSRSNTTSHSPIPFAVMGKARCVCAHHMPCERIRASAQRFGSQHARLLQERVRLNAKPDVVGQECKERGGSKDADKERGVSEFDREPRKGQHVLQSRIKVIQLILRAVEQRTVRDISAWSKPSHMTCARTCNSGIDIGTYSPVCESSPPVCRRFKRSFTAGTATATTLFTSSWDRNTVCSKAATSPEQPVVTFACPCAAHPPLPMNRSKTAQRK